MISAVGTYLVAVVTLTLSIGLLAVWDRRTMKRRRYWHAIHEPVALRIIMRTLVGDGTKPARVRIPDMSRKGLTDTLLHLHISTCNVDRRAMSSLAEAYGAERIIGRLSSLAGGYRRAERLFVLACLPTGRRIPCCDRLPMRLQRQASRSVRFHALLAEMSRTPALAEYLVESYPSPLSLSEIAQIVAMLHRGVIVLDYRRLLRSPNRNLRMIGMAVVRHFSIDAACGELLEMAVVDPDPAICREALTTLCATGSEIAFVEIAQRLRSMGSRERHRLCRCAVVNGYGLDTVESLWGEYERDYAESLVESYKYIMV